MLPSWINETKIAHIHVNILRLPDIITINVRSFTGGENEGISTHSGFASVYENWYSFCSADWGLEVYEKYTVLSYSWSFFPVALMGGFPSIIACSSSVTTRASCATDDALYNGIRT